MSDNDENSDIVRGLLEQGYTLDKIVKILRDPGQKKQAQQVLGVANSGRGIDSFIDRNPSYNGNKIPGQATPNPAYFTLANNVGSASKNLGVSKPQSSLARIVSKTFDPKGNSLGRGIASIVQGIKGDLGRGKLASHIAQSLGQLDRVGNVYRQANAQGVGGDPNSTAAGGGLTYEPETFQQPNFELRDFTPQANEQVGAAFQPRYAAIDQAVQNAQQQYGRADKLTAGLYDNLAASIAKSAADTKAQYAQAVSAEQAQTGELQQNIQKQYDSSQASAAALMAQLGQQEAAPEVLQRGVADAGWNKSQAAVQGNAQQAAINAQGQGQQDYMANVGNAERTQGVVSRESLINQLGQQLSAYDQERMNLAGDQSGTALDIAQRLQDKDFQLQQANYGGYSDAYNARQQNQQQGLGMAELQYRMQQDQFDRNRQFEQDQLSNQRYDQDFQLQRSQFETDLATKAAQLRMDQQRLDLESQPQQTSLADEPDPATNALNQITDNFGGDRQQALPYFTLAQQLAAGLGENVVNETAAGFVQKMAEIAKSKGLNELMAQRAAAAYYANLLRK